MSWWVMEQVSVNDDGTQSLVNIQCDDVSDLPSPNQIGTTGYTIVRGSQAKVLATSENYILGGSGTWVKMEDGVKLDLAGYATEQYVDDSLVVVNSRITAIDSYEIPATTIAPTEGNTDALSNYIVPKAYVIPTGTAAGRITDSPITDKGYVMDVRHYRSGSYYRQTIYAWNDPSVIYTRSRPGGANWSAWYKFQGVVV